MPDSMPLMTEAELTKFVARATQLWEASPTTNQDYSLTQLSMTFPRLSRQCFVSWLGRRLIFWPDGIQQSHRVSIVSSRLGKRKDLKAWWFDGLRTTVLRCDITDECVCAVDGTAAEEYVVRGSELFGIPRLRISIDNDCVDCQAGLVDWLLQCQSSVNAMAGSSADSPLESRALISPQLVADKDEYFCADNLADAILSLAGEKIVALSCRMGGNVEASLSQRLNLAVAPKPIVLLATTNDSPPPSETMINLGGVPWYLDPADNPRTSRVDDTPTVQILPAADWDGPLDSPEQWLCHWTRPAFGPWLDQPSNDFIDELILGCESADRSAVAALLRIVSQQKIIASVSTSGESPTVSFTTVPLAEFRVRRVFRRHKQRFDFEPWGIAIRKDTAELLGAAAVEYLDNESTRPESKFTQRRFDRNSTIDWSEEREWRIAGDLHLNDIPSDSICVFVDSPPTMSRVQPHSPWRTIIVPPPDV